MKNSLIYKLALILAIFAMAGCRFHSFKEKQNKVQDLVEEQEEISAYSVDIDAYEAMIEEENRLESLSDEEVRNGVIINQEIAARPPKRLVAVSAPTKKRVSRVGKYVVKRGDTLKKISRRIYGNPKWWSYILKVNKLKSANSIYPGQVLRYRKRSKPKTRLAH